MGRPSTIDRLPESIREQIAELRRGGRTIAEISAHLARLGHPVSSSTLGRHTQRIDAIGERIRESRAMAEAVIERYGDTPEHRVPRLNIELMHGLIHSAIATASGDQASLPVREIVALSGALRSLAASAKDDVERERQIRARFAKEAEERAVKAGASEESIRLIRGLIEGE